MALLGLAVKRRLRKLRGVTNLHMGECPWRFGIIFERATNVKDAMPVSFRSELFTSYILTIFKQRNLYSRKYEKLPNIVIHACKNITEKMYLLKMSGPQIWLCLFTFRPIASALLAQLVQQRTGGPRVVGLSPKLGTYTFLPNVTLLVSDVILIIYLRHQPGTP